MKGRRGKDGNNERREIKIATKARKHEDILAAPVKSAALVFYEKFNGVNRHARISADWLEMAILSLEAGRIESKKE